MAAPTAYTLEIAFASNPLDASPTWTDVSEYLISGESRRGRNKEFDRSDPGSLKLRLSNNDRRFEPTNTASPYAPNVLPLKKVRLSVTHNAVTYRGWTGYVERWPPAWETSNYSDI